MRPRSISIECLGRVDGSIKIYNRWLQGDLWMNIKMLREMRVRVIFVSCVLLKLLLFSM